MTSLFKAIGQFIRRTSLRLRGVQIATPSRLGRALCLRPGYQAGRRGVITIAASVWIEDGVVLDAWGGSIRLGTNVFLGPYTVIYGHGGVAIGDHTLISMHCRILSSNHTVAPFGTDIRTQPDLLLPTRIGRDVWLGAGVTVLGGVTIGDGCVVGAGAVVTRNLPSGSIAHGVPAEIKSSRAGSPAPG